MGIRGTAKYTFDDIIGNSEKMVSCKEKAVKASRTSSPVLVFGETGTGKELFVQAIHNNSSRNKKPFIAQSCAAIPSNLLETILFGTVRGSFTGAEDKKGLFEIADGGTLYLDELNSMPLELQGKILRVLQEGTIRRVGSTTVKEVDVRVIASLNESPELLLEEGKLRNDLYYRLNVVRINIPTLRQRKEDIPALIDCFINKFNKSFNGAIIGVDEAALERLILWDFEGNIRELEHIIEGAFNLKLEGRITLKDLKELGLNKLNKNRALKERLKEAEKAYILEALTITKYNVSKAAELLEVPRQTLQSKIKKLNIK
jgi:transcriptional regulator with PAS, ATPase and Fis domain